MLAPCTISRPKSQVNGKDWDREAAAKLGRWMQGEFLALWTEAQEAAAVQLGDTEPETPKPEPTPILRAKRMIRYGRYADAAKSLLQEGVVPLTPEVIDTLRQKFPEEEPLAGGVQSHNQNTIGAVNTENVEAKLRTFPVALAQAYRASGLNSLWWPSDMAP